MTLKQEDVFISDKNTGCSLALNRESLSPVFREFSQEHLFNFIGENKSVILFIENCNGNYSFLNLQWS